MTPSEEYPGGKGTTNKKKVQWYEIRLKKQQNETLRKYTTTKVPRTKNTDTKRYPEENC